MFIRLRDKYARANKEVLLKCASPTSTEAEVEKSRQKLSRMYYLDWLEEFIKHRDRPGGASLSASGKNNRSIITKSEEITSTAHDADDDDEDMKPPTMHSYGLDAPITSSTSTTTEGGASNMKNNNANLDHHHQSSSGADDYRVFVVNNNHQQHGSPSTNNAEQHEDTLLVNGGSGLLTSVTADDNSNHSSSNHAPQQLQQPPTKKWCMDDLIGSSEDNKRDIITDSQNFASTASKGLRTSQNSSSVGHQRVIRGTSRNMNLYNSRGSNHRQSLDRYSNTSNSNSTNDLNHYHHPNRHHQHRETPANVIPVLNHKLPERSSSNHHRSSIDVKDHHHQPTSSSTVRYNKIPPPSSSSSSSRINSYGDGPTNQQKQQQKLDRADDFDIFGRYVASKMRKLRYKLSEEEMEELEFEILNTMERKRFNATATWGKASSAIQQSSLSLSVSRKRDYPPQSLPETQHHHQQEDQDEHDQLPVPVVLTETTGDECRQQLTEEDDVEETTTLVEVDNEDVVYHHQQQVSPSSPPH